MAEFPAHLFRMEGDPGAIRSSAGKWSSFGSAASDASAQITSIDTGEFVGPEGDLFRQGLNADMPRHLQITGDAFNKVATALSTFASALESLQDQMRPVAQRAPGLWAAVQAAQGRMDRADAADQAHDKQVMAAPASPTGQPASPDTYYSDSSAASVALGEAQRQWQDCVDAANGLRGQLATTVQAAVRAIVEAKGTRFKENPKWWDIGGQFTNFVRDNKDALQTLSGALKVVSLVAGLLSFIPVLAPVMGPIAIGAGLLAGAIDLSIYAATGQGNLTEILVDVGLNLLPGVGKLARLGAGALKGSKVLTAFSGLAAGFGKIRSGVSDLRSAALAFGGRILKIDPIDVVTGEMVMAQTDIELPGVLPLVLARTHLSSYRAGVWFGRSWASTLDQRLEVDAEYVWYAAPDGMRLAFPVPAEGQPVQPIEGPRLTLVRTGDRYTVTDEQTGHIVHFADLYGFTAGEGVTVLPLVAVSDRNGNRIDIVYGETGVPVEVRHSGGYRVRVDTDLGRIVALTVVGDQDDPTLPAVRFGYDEVGDLTEVINFSGRPLRLDYDSDGRIVRWVDRNGTSYQYEYDTEGRCVCTRGSGGILDSTFEYDTDARTTTLTNSLGHTTVYHRNDHAQVIREVDPLGNATSREWDRYDRKLSETDPLGRTTRYRYDEAGNLVEVTRPDRQRATARYNHMHQPVEVVDVDGAVRRYTYDERGNLTAAVDPLGAMTRYDFDEHGHLTAVVDPLGAVMRITCDDAGLPVTITAPGLAGTGYRRDAAGRIIEITEPTGGVIRTEYTAEGKPARRSLSDGAAESWRYDPEGNMVEYRDPLDHATRFEFGPFDVATARITADGARLEFSYDTELRLVAVTNPDGRVWRYAYDAAGNLIGETDFNDRTLTYALDQAGQLVRRTNGIGQAIEYERDLLGNVTLKRTPEGVTTFAYDLVGRLIGASGPDADLRLSRDGAGRVIAETWDGWTVDSAYDAVGRRVTRRTPSGALTAWQYDQQAQPTAIRLGGQTIGFTYDLAGREVERTIGTTLTMTRSWDVNYRLTAQSLTVQPAAVHPGVTAGASRLVTGRTYRYDRAGSLIQFDDQTTGTEQLTLDPIGRVTAVRATGWAERYAYDTTGRLASAEWPGAGTMPDAEGDREYTGTLVRRAGTIRYEYDAQGRIVLRQQQRAAGRPRTWRYVWDSDDRLVAVVTPDRQHWRYRYDPLGRRVSKQRLGRDGTTVEAETRFVWDANTLAEQHYREPPGTGEPTAEHTIVFDWEPDGIRPLAQRERRSPWRDAPQDAVDERFFAIVTDLAGTPTALVDPAGTVVWRLHTTLWGVDLTGAADHDGTPLRFPGQYHDSETDLNYNFYRHYDPVAARYASSDPVGLLASTDPHSYVRNPVEFIDPLGLAPCALRPGGHIINDVAPHGVLSPGVNRAPGNLNNATDGWVQSHHVIQDEWATRNGIAGYARNDAPAILLKSASGEPHALISAAQRARRVALGYGTSIQDEFRASYQQLLGGGVPQDFARKAIKDAYKYFSSIGAI
jgi:RHS repeat-associated protein